VQAFGREQAPPPPVRRGGREAFRASLRRITARAAMTAAVIVLVFGGIVGVFWLGVHRPACAAR
jgi:ATP-binding cassette subfamily B protein